LDNHTNKGTVRPQSQAKKERGEKKILNTLQPRKTTAGSDPKHPITVEKKKEEQLSLNQDRRALEGVLPSSARKLSETSLRPKSNRGPELYQQHVSKEEK